MKLMFSLYQSYCFIDLPLGSAENDEIQWMRNGDEKFEMENEWNSEYYRKNDAVLWDVFCPGRYVKIFE